MLSPASPITGNDLDAEIGRWIDDWHGLRKFKLTSSSLIGFARWNGSQSENLQRGRA